MTPSTGLVTDFALKKGMLQRPVSGSSWTNLCEVKPEIYFKLKKVTPFKQTQFLDPLFSEFLSVTPLNFPRPEIRWGHSDMSQLAFQKALAKYCRPWEDIVEDDLWAKAGVWLHKLISPVCSGSSLTPFSHVLDDSELNTSPGPLWRVQFETKGQFIASDIGWDVFHKFWDSLSEPGGELSLWGSYLKDEIRLQEKIDDSKTRLFLIAPVEHHISMSVMCSDFNQRIIDAASSGRTPVAVGMNIYNGGFCELGLNLRTHSTSKHGPFFADVSGWDTLYKTYFAKVILWLRFSMLRPEERTWENFHRLINLYRDNIWTPVVLPDGAVVFVLHQPSGQLNTAMDNSLALTLIFVYAYLTSGCPHDFTYFIRNVFLRTFGDDSAVASLDPRFNPDHVKSVFEEIGYEVEFSHYWEFLGHFICWSESLSVYVPVFPYHKAIASLCLSGSPNISKLVSKAMSVRMLVFSNAEAFALVDAYCLWLLDRFPERHDFRAQYLPCAEIEALVKGRADSIARASFKAHARGSEASESKESQAESEKQRKGAEQQCSGWVQNFWCYLFGYSQSPTGGSKSPAH